MKLRDVIAQLQQFADQMDEDAEFELYDRSEDRAIIVGEVDGDEIWDFDISRGSNLVVIEFD